MGLMANPGSWHPLDWSATSRSEHAIHQSKLSVCCGILGGISIDSRHVRAGHLSCRTSRCHAVLDHRDIDFLPLPCINTQLVIPRHHAPWERFSGASIGSSLHRIYLNVASLWFTTGFWLVYQVSLRTVPDVDPGGTTYSEDILSNTLKGPHRHGLTFWHICKTSSGMHSPYGRECVC